MPVSETIRLRGTLLFASACCAALVGCHNLTSTAERALLTQASREASTHSASGQWPSWRGGLADGVADDARLPLAWSMSEGVRWKSPVPGIGHSSPIVWGDHVFLTSVVGRGEQAELTVLCFDRHSGALHWRRELGRPVGSSHEKNGHASATCATDGQHLYASFGAKGLFCLKLDGEVAWFRSLSKPAHKWGTSSCPILFGPLVIQLCDGESQSCLVALDKLTGEEVWNTPRPSNGCWSTPVLMETQNAGERRWELIVNGTGSHDGSKGFVIAYNPATGEEQWRVQGTTDIPVPTAIIADNMVISTSGSSGPILAISPGGSGDVTVSHVRWEVPGGAPYVPTGVAYQGRLFMISDTGVASAYELASGRELWKQRLGSPVSASLLAGAGRVYVTSETGEIYVLAAADNFELLATNEMHEPCLATPAIAQGEFFVRTQSHLYCISQLSSPSDLPPVAASSEDAPSPSDGPLPVVAEEPETLTAAEPAG